MITAALTIPHFITLHSLGANLALIDELHSIPTRHGYIVAFAIENDGCQSAWARVSHLAWRLDLSCIYMAA